MLTSAEREMLTQLELKRREQLFETQQRVQDLEKRAELIHELQLQRLKMDILEQLPRGVSSDLLPSHRELSQHVSDLKQYLQTVHQADRSGEAGLKRLTTEHCLSYAVRLINKFADASSYTILGALGVIELAAASLCMFSQRPAAHSLMLQHNAIPAAIKLLSLLYPTATIENAAKTLGNLAVDPLCRGAVRSHDGVGALVRLLRADCPAKVQAASAAALALLSAHDAAVQDSIRYLGGIELLVELLAAPDAYVAEVARYCLLSARHGNRRNQQEILSSVKGNTSLLKDYYKLRRAVELLRTDLADSSAATGAGLDSLCRSLQDALIDKLQSRSKPANFDFLLDDEELLGSPSSKIKAVRPAAETYKRPSTANAASYSRHASPTRTVGGREPVAGGKGARAQQGHICCLSVDAVCDLLREVGFDRFDLKGIRAQRIDGIDLLSLTESEMSLELGLPKSRARKVQKLQAATSLFDDIASRPGQGRLSELELRLYLSSIGCSPVEVNKIVKLIKSLILTDVKQDHISCCEFALGFEWVQHAFKIYGVRI